MIIFIIFYNSFCIIFVSELSCWIIHHVLKNIMFVCTLHGIVHLIIGVFFISRCDCCTVICHCRVHKIYICSMITVTGLRFF